MSITRRRFLALCGGAISGIWLAGKGLMRLPTEMVFALSGSCSYCGKEPRQLFGIAGIIGRDARICNECIDLCFDILAEEAGVLPPSPPPIVIDVPAHILADSNTMAQLHARMAAGERGEPILDALAAAWEARPDGTGIAYQPVPEPPPPSAAELRAMTRDIRCSFCDAHYDDVKKIIAGPRVYICDACIGDAGGLFMRYGWHPTHA